MRRFFVDVPLAQAETVPLSAEVAHHIKVLRLRCGTQILLSDGHGQCCHCQIDTLSAAGGQATVIKRWFEAETALPITLLQGLPAGDKFDLVLQKNTELGVTRFQPVVTERSQFAVPAAKIQRKMERWQRIVDEAARQSGRAWLPAVQPPQPLCAAARHCDAELKLLLWEDASQPLRVFLPARAPQSVAVLIGPEGGLSAQEVAQTTATGFVAVGLGPRILRTETAAMALVSILQFHYGDLDRLARSAPTAP